MKTKVKGKGNKVKSFEKKQKQQRMELNKIRVLKIFPLSGQQFLQQELSTQSIKLRGLLSINTSDLYYYFYNSFHVNTNSIEIYYH